MLSVTHLPVDGFFGFENSTNVFEKIALEIMSESLNRSSNVLRQQVKRPSNFRCESSYIQVTVEKNNTYVGTAEQVVYIVGHLGQLNNFLLILTVDGVKFFVDRLQFFVGALHFLVGGDKFFVGRLKFFVGRFQLLDSGLQVLFCIAQFAFETRDVLA